MLIFFICLNLWSVGWCLPRTQVHVNNSWPPVGHENEYEMRCEGPFWIYRNNPGKHNFFPCTNIAPDTELLICSHPLHLSWFSMLFYSNIQDCEAAVLSFPSTWSYSAACTRPYILFISKKVKLCARLPFCLYFLRLGGTTREYIPLWSFARVLSTYTSRNVIFGRALVSILLSFKKWEAVTGLLFCLFPRTMALDFSFNSVFFEVWRAFLRLYSVF